MYRHSMSKHGDIFRAIVVITQLEINSDEKLFECKYNDPPYIREDIEKEE